MGVKKLKNTLDRRPHKCFVCGELATWAALGCVKKEYSCDAHKPDLDAYFLKADKLCDERDNGYRSEADYQTWMRL